MIFMNEVLFDGFVQLREKFAGLLHGLGRFFFRQKTRGFAQRGFEFR